MFVIDTLLIILQIVGIAELLIICWFVFVIVCTVVVVVVIAVVVITVVVGVSVGICMDTVYDTFLTVLFCTCFTIYEIITMWVIIVIVGGMMMSLGRLAPTDIITIVWIGV